MEKPFQHRTPDHMIQAIEMLRKFSVSLKPPRVRPDLTVVEANLALAKLSGRYEEYDFTNLLDIDKAMQSLHSLTPSKLGTLSEYISNSAERFQLSTSSVTSRGSIINFGMELKVVPTSDIQVPRLNIYSNIGCTIDTEEKFIKISSFYPSNATIRGYSVGTEIINILEEIAKRFDLKQMEIDRTTSDAIGFYTRVGFKQDPQSPHMMIKELQ